VNLPATGDWTLKVTVERGGQHADFSLPLRVVKPDTSGSIPWSYLVLIGLSAIFLFTYVRRRVTARTASQPHSVARRSGAATLP
jgi:hypothetical protein